MDIKAQTLYENGTSAAFRVESDEIGEQKVAAEALYGIRTHRCFRSLSFSGLQLKDFPAYVKALCQVKKAAAGANANAGVIKQDLAASIQRACDQLIAGHHYQHLIVDVLAGGGSIGINMNINEVISNLVNLERGEPLGSVKVCDPKNHVNASQSTADVCHTAIRLAIIDSMEDLFGQVDEFITVAESKQRAFEDTSIMGRTCLQDAMQVSLGDIFGAHASLMIRTRQRFDQSVRELHQINLGGTIIGDQSGADPDYRAEVLVALQHVCGRPVERRGDLKDAAQNKDDLIALSNNIGILSAGLNKIAGDLRLLSSSGFRDIRLPVTQEGSAFFTGKVNPVVSETLIQACCQVDGHLYVVTKSLEQGELDLNVFEGIAGINLLQAVDLMAAGLKKFIPWCYQGIEPAEQVI